MVLIDPPDLVPRPVLGDLTQGIVSELRIRPFYVSQQAGVIELAEEVVAWRWRSPMASLVGIT